MNVRKRQAVIELKNDSYITSAGTMQWTVVSIEKFGKSLIGSAASSEDFGNVYRGTGKILLAPVSSFTNYSKKKKYHLKMILLKCKLII